MKTLQQLLDTIHTTTDFTDVEHMKVNSKGLFDNTPLHVTVTWGDEESAEQLIAAGADVNAQGEYGFTPLHEAISNNNPKLVALFLNNGADPRIRNGDDCNDLANKLGNIQLLLNKRT